MAGLYPGNVGLAVREGFPPRYTYAILADLRCGDRFAFDVRLSPREIAFTVLRSDGRYVVCVRDDGPREFKFLRSRLVVILLP